MSADHTISESCPIRRLGLTQTTEDTLVVHWHADGIEPDEETVVYPALERPDAETCFVPGTHVAGIIRRRAGVST
jgi:hypothetical protein